MFLDGIARDRQWTFYKATREGESNLGEAFAILIKELERKNYEKLINRIETWLSSGDANLMWLASEVIGYRKIEDLKDET